MGCPKQVDLADDLTFSVTIHDPATSGLVDPSAGPSYLVYEKETTLAILSGTMSKHNGRTGFYIETIACTTANGFEVGKGYTIEIEATVGSITGGISHSFLVGGGPTTINAIKAKTDLLGGVTVIVPIPFLTSSGLEVSHGADYLLADGRELRWTIATPDLTGFSAGFKVYDIPSGTLITTAIGTITNAGTTTQSLYVELSAAKTTLIPAGPYMGNEPVYEVWVTKTGDAILAAYGKMQATKTYAVP